MCPRSVWTQARDVDEYLGQIKLFVPDYLQEPLDEMSGLSMHPNQ